jgi:hypothetical protein
MVRVYTGPFIRVIRQLLKDFSGAAEPVDVGQWQSVDIKGDASRVTWELREAVLAIEMQSTIDQAQREYSPSLPWAEDHFLERVSGKPLNPPPSQAWWPFAQNGNDQHKKGGKFSHTYPERFWPRFAGKDLNVTSLLIDGVEQITPRRGIRFAYGDLHDVITRIAKNPQTRQAYLPIWFPEDTGAPDSERVPCTLGYLFMVRGGKLHLTYHIRSCDFMRHFRDDVYMAVRLGQWIVEILDREYGLMLEVGELTMHIGSFHIFAGDRPMLNHLLREALKEANHDLLRGLGQ